MEDGWSVPPVTPYERCLLCPCNAGTCLLLTSKTPVNPDRDFYRCPTPEQCSIGKNGFFKWADKVRAEEFIDVPYCGGCMAGRCRVSREMSGSNFGRILFTCRVKEGQGSCGYRVWQDELNFSLPASICLSTSSPPSTLIECNDTGLANFNLAKKHRPSKKVVQSFMIKEEDEPPLVATSRKMKQLKSKEDKSLILPELRDGEYGSESTDSSVTRKNKVSKCDCGLNPILLTLSCNTGRLLWSCPLEKCDYFRWEDNAAELLRTQSLLKRVEKLEALIRKYCCFIKLLISITVTSLIVMGILFILK